jgi:hypothetical protein
VDCTFSSPVSLTSGDYWLFVFGDASAAGLWFYANASGGTSGWNSDTYEGVTTPPEGDPSDPMGSLTSESVIYAVYATYTATGGTTFGDTTPYTSEDNLNQANYKSVGVYTLSEEGTTSKVSFYLRNPGAACNVKAVIYRVSDGALMGTGDPVAVGAASAVAWYDSTLVKTLPAGDYYLGLIGDSACTSLIFRCSTGGTYYWNSDTYATAADPATPPAWNAETGVLSCYATYAATGGGGGGGAVSGSGLSRISGGGPDIIKVGGQDFSLSGPPFYATSAQFSGGVPGGHGSFTFDVPVSSAYQQPFHALKVGEWVEVTSNGVEMYEGEILSLKPSANSSGGHKITVTCGGLFTKAGKRADVTATWVNRGPKGWMRRPGTPSNLGNVNLDNGAVELRISAGSAEDFRTASLTDQLCVVFVLDGGLSDDKIAYVELAGSYDVSLESATYSWVWTITTGDWLGGPGTWSYYQSNSSSTTFSYAFTPPFNTTVLYLLVWQNGGALHTLAADRYVSLTTCNIYGRGRSITAFPSSPKPRIDEVLVDLATQEGLAGSYVNSIWTPNYYSEPVGAPLDEVTIGQDKAKTSVAAGQQTIANLFAQPFEWAYWDNRKFWCRPTPSPSSDKTIVVGGDNPGLVSWDVTEGEETVPQFVCVLFGNKDSALVPEGFVRQIYRPSDPPTSGDYRVMTLDYSGYILTDSAAASLGDSYIGSSSGGEIPSGQIFDANPTKAAAGGWGNNTDPTSTYREDYGLVNGTMTGFAYTTASGWGGSNSLNDPVCLVGDGNADYVDFGNVSAANFGTGAFSVRVRVKIVTPPVVDAVTLICKLNTSQQGWWLGITGSQKVYGYVGESVANYRSQVGSTMLAPGGWYHVVMTYPGSGNDISLYVNTVAETMTAAGSVGAWNLTNTSSLYLMRRS